MTVPNEPLKAFMMMYTTAGSTLSPHGMPGLEPDRRQPFGRQAGLS